jgi:putative copper export protein
MYGQRFVFFDRYIVMLGWETPGAEKEEMHMMYKIAILLHILGACIWVGGHLLLSIRIVPAALKTKNVSLIRNFEQAFEPVGIPALLVQVITGLWIAFGHYHLRLFSMETGMEKAVTLKLALLLITLILAIHARFFIIPRLNEAGLKKMVFHILLITFVALAMLYTGVQFRFGGI